jgi:hypothetical protein
LRTLDMLLVVVAARPDVQQRERLATLYHPLEMVDADGPDMLGVQKDHHEDIRVPR